MLPGEAVLIVQPPVACCEMVDKTNDSWPIQSVHSYVVPRYSILAHQRDKARALRRLVLSVAVFGTAQLSGGEKVRLGNVNLGFTHI